MALTQTQKDVITGAVIRKAQQDGVRTEAVFADLLVMTSPQRVAALQAYVNVLKAEYQKRKDEADAASAAAAQQIADCTAALAGV